MTAHVQILLSCCSSIAQTVNCEDSIKVKEDAVTSISFVRVEGEGRTVKVIVMIDDIV